MIFTLIYRSFNELSLSHDIVFIFFLISLNFFFHHFVTCSRKRKKFCKYVTFFHPTISHCFVREKQIRLSYLFHFRTNCVPRAPKKKRKKETLGVDHSFPTLPKRVATTTVSFFLEDPNQNGSTIPPFLALMSEM